MRIKGGIWRLLRLPKPYRKADFTAREAWREEYTQLAGMLLDLVEFDSVLDVGCANGFLLEEFQRQGKSVGGIELSPAIKDILPPELIDKVEIGDFSQATGSWDLVCCVEVAEHIRPGASGKLVSTLARVATDWIYFTAAPPEQGGRGHINCRPRQWWLDAFRDVGWREAPEKTAMLREQLEALEKAPWLATNSMVLRPE